MTVRALHPLGRLPEEWEPVFEELGERAFRGRQIFRWIHGRGTTDVSQMTDLPLALREKLVALDLSVPVEVLDVKRAHDGTRKLVLELAAGGRVECVVIPMSDDPDDEREDNEPWDGRVTLCVSTQIGCAMGCVFCASGQAGLERGLLAHEIVAQVLLARRYLEPGEHLRNLVFMGMGEPLHHYDETARALRLLTHPEGTAMSPRRITVSTVGLVPGIRKLGEDFAGKVGLAVSLHAPNDTIRSRIVPMNDRYSMDDILAALAAYPLPKRRRITIEYTLIRGVNDEVAHARELASRLRKLPVKVNLIPMNTIGQSSLEAATDGRVEAFREALAGAGLSAFVRKRRGDEVSAACGQLVLAERLAEKRRSGKCSGAFS